MKASELGRSITKWCLGIVALWQVLVILWAHVMKPGIEAAVADGFSDERLKRIAADSAATYQRELLNLRVSHVEDNQQKQLAELKRISAVADRMAQKYLQPGGDK